jgi:hypothetical protein
MGSSGGNWPRKTKGACEPATHPLTAAGVGYTTT